MKTASFTLQNVSHEHIRITVRKRKQTLSAHIENKIEITHCLGRPRQFAVVVVLVVVRASSSPLSSSSSSPPMPQFIRDFSLYNRRLKGLHTSLELPFCVNHTWMTKKKLQKGSVLICHHLQSPCDFSGSFAMLLRELGLRKGDKK